MSIMNETVVQTTKFNNINNTEFLWNMYYGSHPMADFKSNPAEARGILQFVAQSCKFPGTVVTVDSFMSGQATFDVDQAYELEAFKGLWPESYSTIIPTMWHVPTEIKYDNVIAVGSHSFKYMTLDRYVEAVEHLLKLTCSGGHLVVCMPKLHLQYHRLRYKPVDLIDQLKTRIAATISNSVEFYKDFYLKITNE
jgi:hypothetical protein